MMTATTYTRHGEARMSQRGIRKDDLEILLTYGTDIGRNRIMLRKRDAARLIHDLKKRIAKIERLTDKVLVVAGGQLITAYHQSASTQPSFHRTKRPRSRQLAVGG